MLSLGKVCMCVCVWKGVQGGLLDMGTSYTSMFTCENSSSCPLKMSAPFSMCIILQLKSFKSTKTCVWISALPFNWPCNLRLVILWDYFLIYKLVYQWVGRRKNGTFFTGRVGGRTEDSQQITSESGSVVSNSLRPHGLYSPWNSPGQNTGVGSLSLLS